jgi:hypothetical protein
MRRPGGVRLPWLAVPVLALFGWFIGAHPYGGRFALGIWPVPAGTPWTYQLESGFIPALTVVGLVTLITGAWHHVNCHSDGCWRLGKHKVDGTPWCNRHHENARHGVRVVPLEEKIGELVDLLLAAERRQGPPQ